MTRAEFLELGNYISLLSTRITTYDAKLLCIHNSMFKYVILTGKKCCIKSIKDSDNKVCSFDTLEQVKDYIRSFSVEGAKRI